MRIQSVDSFILHVPVTSAHIADSTHSITHWGVVGARIGLDNGLVGYGWTGTHAHLPSDRLIADCIAKSYGPILIGKDTSAHVALATTLERQPELLWIGRAGIVQMALSAIDVALWDLKAKAGKIPLWALLGGAQRQAVEAYNTDIGWLSIPPDQLVASARRAVEQDGFRAIKLKVGHADYREDIARVASVRKAVGRAPKIAVDANGRWDLSTCRRFVAEATAHDVLWFEEPLWFDDYTAHGALAATSPIPIALGESLYTVDAFREIIDKGGVHFAQPDVTRVGGISGYLRVQSLCDAHHVPVTGHAGEMSQVHQHLAIAAREHLLPLEYIPWIRHCFTEPARVADGRYQLPEQPGASTTPTEEALSRFGRK